MRRRGEADVVSFLATAGREPAVSRFERGTETAEATARELGVEASRIVKSLVLAVDGRPLLALLPGHRRADTGAIRRLLGAERVRLADPAQVEEWTGYAVGAVPPVAHVAPLPVLVDEAIPADGPVFPAAGERNNAFRTSRDDLLAMTGGRLAAVSRGEG